MALEQSEAQEFDVAAQCERMISCRIGGYPPSWEQQGPNYRKHVVGTLLFELGLGFDINGKERFLGIDKILEGLEGEERTQKIKELLAQIRAHLEAELAKIK